MNSEKGVTLLELVIGIVIMSICLTSIGAVISGMALRTANVETVQTGTELANGMLEIQTGLGYDNVVDISPTIYPWPFDDYAYEVIVHYVDPADLDTPVDPTVTDYKSIEVRISHDLLGTTSMKGLVGKD